MLHEAVPESGMWKPTHTNLRNDDAKLGTTGVVLGHLLGRRYPKSKRTVTFSRADSPANLSQSGFASQYGVLIDSVTLGL